MDTNEKLNVIINELQEARRELAEDNDRAELRDFLRKYPWLTEADYRRMKETDAKIAAYYRQPAEVISRDFAAAANENRARGWTND